MKITGIVAAVIAAFCLCLPGPARGDELGESYYPLKDGMRWEYRVLSDKHETQNVTITNLAPRDVKGVKVTPRKWQVGGQTFLELMEKDANGIYRYAEQKGETAAPEVITPKEWHLKFPIAEGSTWDMTTKLDDRPMKISLTIESVTDKVTVPAGTFTDCLKVKQVGGNDAGAAVTGYEWYAPKVGIVKSMVTIKRQAKDKTETENRNYQLLSVKP